MSSGTTGDQYKTSSGSLDPKEPYFTADQVKALRDADAQSTDIALKSLFDRIKSLENTVTETMEESSKVKKDIIENNGKVKGLEERIQSSSSQAFAILAIFTTVFTFISLNVSIFQSTSKASEAVFFMAIIAALCAIIVSVPLLILQSINERSIKNSKLIRNIFVIGFLSLCVIAFITWMFDFDIAIQKINDHVSK